MLKHQKVSKFYQNGCSKDLVSKNEVIKCDNIIKHYKMVNFDDVVKENIKYHKWNRPKYPQHSYRILIIGISRQRKTNSIFILIN